MKTSLVSVRISEAVVIGYLTFFVYASITTLAEGAEKDNNQIMIGRLQEIETLSDKDKEILVLDARHFRQHIQEVLLTKMGSAREDAKPCVVYLLGEYRCAEAVDNLSRVITLEDKSFLLRKRKNEWLWDLYPVVEALIKIGNPSIPAVIRNLEESDDVKVIELSLQVLRNVENNKEIAQLRLQRALDAQQNPLKQARLRSVLRSLDTVFR